jgi:putative transposase
VVSAAANCGHRTDVLLKHHPAYVGLAATSEARVETYHCLLRETLSDNDLAAIRAYLQQQRVWGGAIFGPWPRPKAAASPVSVPPIDHHTR